MTSAEEGSVVMLYNIFAQTNLVESLELEPDVRDNIR